MIDLEYTSPNTQTPGTRRRSETASIVAATDVFRFSDHSPYQERYQYGISGRTLPNKAAFNTSFVLGNSRPPSRPWSTAKVNEEPRGKILMSERPHSHAVTGSASQEAESQSTRPALTSASSGQAALQASPAPLYEPPLRAQRPSMGSIRGFELPPLSRSNTANTGAASPSITRIAGVASILNPTESEPQTGHRRKLSQLTSPVSSAQRLPSLAASVRSDRDPSARQEHSPGAQRRFITPRSPSALHRTASLGQLHTRSTNLDAHQVPFPPSPHRHTVEPGRGGVPPLPTPPARLQTAGYGFPTPAAQNDASRRASTGTNRPRNLSSSASPSTSYSSYSQAGQTSPAGRYAPTASAALLPSYSGSLDGAQSQQRKVSDSAASDSQRQMGIPISSSGGQNVYQMMTLETTSGTVQLPVDVQAASRVADEKRRRNAGASARFRQRRKEKEREASTSIARLEQQVKELGEEVDFYRNERAGLLSVLRGVPGMEHHLQRPPSPQQLRGSMGSMSMMSRRTSYMRASDQEQQSPELGRNVRRRISTTYSLPPGPPPPGPPLQPSYAPSSYNTPIAPQPAGVSLPSLSAAVPRQEVPAPPPAQAHPQTGPYEQYSRGYPEVRPKDRQ